MLTLPYWLGVGSVKRVRLAPDFSLLIHQCTLTEELTLKRTAADNTADRVNLLFQLHTGLEGQSDLHDVAPTDRHAGHTIRTTSPLTMILPREIGGISKDQTPGHSRA